MMEAVRRRLVSLIVACAVLGSAGCNAGRVFIATSGDYADYRAVRVAENVDERLARSWAYLQTRPDGRYAERLRRFFSKAEPVFFRVRSRSIKGLEAYLRALPDGPHADEALELLVAKRDARRRDSTDARETLATTMRLDTERKKRARAAELLLWWVSSFMDVDVWKAPLSKAPKELVIRYRLSLPQPRCEAVPDEVAKQRCVKPIERGFRVPGDGQLEERALAFLLQVTLDERWHLQQVAISGEGIFLATEEARSGKAVEGTATEQAAAAAAFVAQLTAGLFERGVACNGGTEASGRTVLNCEGLRLTLVPGSGGGDDVLHIFPEDEDDAGSEEPGVDPYE
jgi:hypothetical protein